MRPHLGPIELTLMSGETLLVDVSRVVSVREVRAFADSGPAFLKSTVTLDNGCYYEVAESPDEVSEMWHGAIIEATRPAPPAPCRGERERSVATYRGLAVPPDPAHC